MADNYTESVKNVFSSAKQIMEYLGISKELYAKFRIEGVIINNKIFRMPILVVDNRHYATKQNLDAYWNMVTMCDSSKYKGEEDEN